MSAVGRSAHVPPPGWRPAQRRDGVKVLFVSEDGTQRKVFDFASLPAAQPVREKITQGFAAACGPLGSYKRLASAVNLYDAGRMVTSWLASTRPGINSLAELTRADARMLARSFIRDRDLGCARTLLSYCATTGPQVRDEMTRHRIPRQNTARQPYESAELARICVVARAIVRRARDRIWEHRALLEDFRAGRMDHLDHRDRLRCLVVSLDHCDRHGDVSRSGTHNHQDYVVLRGLSHATDRYSYKEPMIQRLHLSAGEAWAFAVLLAALSGLNASVLNTLPAAYLRATTGSQPGTALVDTNKPRRQARAQVTLPLSALPDQLDPGEDSRPVRVRNTSLTTAFGVYCLLVDLTEPARRHLGSQRAFVYYRRGPGKHSGGHFAHGLPAFTPERRKTWTQAWLTGDAAADNVLTEISLDRLRKTRIELARRPIAHTPATYASYLGRMTKVTEEGFEVIREALDDQVARALNRRRIRVVTDEDNIAAEDPGTTSDTVLGNCTDFRHAPTDDGGPCQQSFLACLDCTNARAFPRHLPAQILVRDSLAAMRSAVPAGQWAAEFAGKVAQLDDILAHYTDAQRQVGRAQITNGHRVLVGRLLSGDLNV